MSSVSHATRPSGSWLSTASRTESEIWSAILSGWPSVTDSEVKVWRVVTSSLLELSSAPGGIGTPYAPARTLSAQAIDHTIQNGVGHLVLRGQRDLAARAVAAQDGHGVGVVVEADVLAPRRRWPP